MKKIFSVLSVLLVASASSSFADSKQAMTNPEKGVLCDRFICADKNGVSKALTARHLGEAAARRLASQGEFDTTQFTFANGVFCDTKEALCRKDRYFDAQGKRSAVDAEYTAKLFGEPS